MEADDSFPPSVNCLEEECIDPSDIDAAALEDMALGFEGRRRLRPMFLGAKCVVDAVIALLGLITLSPLLIITAGLIKLGSRGPVLFTHVREGKQAKPFRCYKFRTMVEGAHAQQRELYAKSTVDGPQFEIPSDPRMTRIGRWLRPTNIDELPQLLNVLMGQMSLIGPRPSPFRENQICVPWRLARLSVRPGITGLWQLCRHDRSMGDFHQWIYYDTLYVRHVSFWLDLKILIATVLTLGGRWSVPLSWMIPSRKLHEEENAPVVFNGAPILDLPAPEEDAWPEIQIPGGGPELADAVPADCRLSSIPCPGRELILQLRSLAFSSLASMYRPDKRLFASSVRSSFKNSTLKAIGLSRRCTATVLIGLADYPEEAAARILFGRSAQEVGERLLEDIDKVDDVGEVALTYWSARALKLQSAAKALRRLRSLDTDRNPCTTLELAWSLASLTVSGNEVANDALAGSIARRLVSSFVPSRCLFRHWPEGCAHSSPCSEIACFQDQVFPIYALIHYHKHTSDLTALHAADRCAERICALQGPEGQWWWRYDVRSGQVAGRYPVYSVHQGALAPMALLPLRASDGTDYGDAVKRGLEWLKSPPETASPLVDLDVGLIWRKVARDERLRISLSSQWLARHLHPGLRVPGLNLLLPPPTIDFECRADHWGWLLHAWSPERVRLSRGFRKTEYWSPDAIEPSPRPPAA